MEKMKWHYDKKHKIWWTGETTPYANDDYSIVKTGKKYRLDYDNIFVGYFKKLSSAKTVAQLLRHG